MKTALNARMFAMLDSGTGGVPGVIDGVDLMKAFAGINGMSAVQATKMAKYVVDDAGKRATKLQTDKKFRKLQSKLHVGDAKAQDPARATVITNARGSAPTWAAAATAMGNMIDTAAAWWSSSAITRVAR